MLYRKLTGCSVFCCSVEEMEQTFCPLPPAGRSRVCICVCVRSVILFLLSFGPVASICPGICICASDIINCPQRNLSSPPRGLPGYATLLDLSFNHISRLRSDWTAVRLSGLRSLLLSHNALHFVSSEAFLQVRRLRYLDLSSNALTYLDEFVFEPLPHLEVLMLYDNRISRIDRMAFSGLLGLQRLYLSHNRVNHFPLDLLKDRNRLDKLRLLDISSNQIRTLPLAELQALPTWLKESIYFHGNPLACSCHLYSILIAWKQRELRPISEFSESHVCVQPGSPMSEAKTNILQLHLKLNCSAVRVRDQEAFLNQILILDCDSRFREAVKSWTLPPLAKHSTAQTLADGRLQVGPLRVEDAGEYRCAVEGEGVNETVVVTVKVHNSTQGFRDGLNTAYTTLACCILAVILVLFYLYLTPCHCGNHLATNTDSVHTSSQSVTISQQGALRVSFQEPEDQSCGIESEEEEQEEGCTHEQDTRNKRSSITLDTPGMV